MLITELRKIGDKTYNYNTSDSNFFIKRIQDDVIFIEAYDPIEYVERRTYIETDIEIEPIVEKEHI